MVSAYAEEVTVSQFDQAHGTRELTSDGNRSLETNTVQMLSRTGSDQESVIGEAQRVFTVGRTYGEAAF